MSESIIINTSVIFINNGIKTLNPNEILALTSKLTLSPITISDISQLIPKLPLPQKDLLHHTLAQLLGDAFQQFRLQELQFGPPDIMIAEHLKPVSHQLDRLGVFGDFGSHQLGPTNENLGLGYPAPPLPLADN